MKTLLTVLLMLNGAVCAERGLEIKCRVTVPAEYRRTPFRVPPNGDPESVRYKKAYEAFWWNCVAVRGVQLQGRCPFAVSGTPAASAGANHGARNADRQIDGLLRKYPGRAVQEYLRSSAAHPEVKIKMRAYFDSPTPEAVK